MQCDWATSTFLIFSDNSIPLIYYSHITSIIIFLCLFALTFRQLKDWPKAPFRLMVISYIIWLFCDLVLWGNELIPHIMFFWTIINLVEPLIFIGAFIFFLRFVDKREVTMKEKWAIFLLLVPTIIMAPIGWSTVGFDYTTCDRNVIEGIAAYYNYFLEFLLLAFTLGKTLVVIFSKRFIGQKLKLSIIGMSISLLLFSFLVANFLGTYLTDYDISQYGHIAVPIFAILLTYMTIKFESFEPKILLIDSLVAAVIVLIISLFFAEGETQQKYITGLTLFLAIPMAYNLVTTIRREVHARKEVQSLAVQLEASNEKLKGLDKLKTEFLSLASHQLRSPLTAIKGYASMLTEGSFGKLDEKQDEAVRRIYTSAQGLVSIVEDLLNVSKIEQGGMKYEMMPTDVTKIVTDLYNEMKIPAENKKLEFILDIPNHDPFMAIIDPLKMKQTFLNLTDNSIKYTEKGFVKLSLGREGSNIYFAVSDSGVGISPETKAKLFEKFSRGEGGKLNTGGSGLGLYLAREIARAHKGDILILSDGLGKGSTFKVVFPAAGASVVPNVIPS
jgi:signal transduction histidine kinase